MERVSGTIMIGAMPYKVSVVEDLYSEAGYILGEADPGNLTIKLSAALPPRLRELGLLHEIFHVVLAHAGYAEHPEGMVQALAHGALSIFPILFTELEGVLDGKDGQEKDS